MPMSWPLCGTSRATVSMSGESTESPFARSASRVLSRAGENIVGRCRDRALQQAAAPSNANLLHHASVRSATHLDVAAMPDARSKISRAVIRLSRALLRLPHFPQQVAAVHVNNVRDADSHARPRHRVAHWPDVAAVNDADPIPAESRKPSRPFHLVANRFASPKGKRLAMNRIRLAAIEQVRLHRS